MKKKTNRKKTVRKKRIKHPTDEERLTGVLEMLKSAEATIKEREEELIDKEKEIQWLLSHQDNIFRRGYNWAITEANNKGLVELPLAFVCKCGRRYKFEK